MVSPKIDRAWEAEALRLCERYIEEVVLAFELCPWAEPSLRAGRVSRAVCLTPDPRPGDCLSFVQELARAAREDLDIGLLIFPNHHGGWRAFDTFAERVRRALLASDSERPGSVGASRGASAGFLVAAFHPDGAQTFVGPHQLVSFLRRTPDPLLQFVRAELIDQVKRSQPSVSEGVALRNHKALQGARAAALDRVTRDISADRQATYARLRQQI